MAEDLPSLLVEEVDPANCSFKPFDGFIFVCGGPHQETGRELRSIRQYAVRQAARSAGYLVGRKVILAEQMTSLLQGADFADLLDFEEHIAALSACVLIFVESPGSIAELGSFSVMEHLSPKLLVVGEQTHQNDREPSFIALGPYERLRRRRPDSVQIFPFFSRLATGETVLSEEQVQDCWEDVENQLRAAVEVSKSRPLFDPVALHHQMNVIVGLLVLFVALRLGEIAECLNALGCKVSNKAIGKQLRMLSRVGLVEVRQYGSELFYFGKDESARLILKPKDASAKIFDQTRFKLKLIEHYEKSDSRKRKAIAAFLREQQYRPEVSVSQVAAVPA